VYLDRRTKEIIVKQLAESGNGLIYVSSTAESGLMKGRIGMHNWKP
jgi:hypothetical protein